MNNRRHSPLHGRRRRRGSVFVLVVAILAVLSLLILTLNYSSEMELRASRNWVDAIQAKVSAITGVPFFNPGVPRDPPIIGSGVTSGGILATAPNQEKLDRQVPLDLGAPSIFKDPVGPAVSGFRASASPFVSTSRAGEGAAALLRSQRDREAKEDAEFREQLSEVLGPLGRSRIEDESAKMNVNAIWPDPPSQASGAASKTEIPGIQDLTRDDFPSSPPQPRVRALAALIEEVLKSKSVQPDRSSIQLAAGIAARRYGRDGAPGVAQADDNGDSGQINPNADGLDNDQDQVIDNPEEETFAVNANGADDDRNGLADDADESILTDGLDNDYDGVIDEADEALDDPREFCEDIRLPARGDDVPYSSLDDLMGVEGMTPEVLEALRPHLTVFSVSHPAYPDRETQGQSGLRQLDPNTARAPEIFRALRDAFPAVSEDLAGQFTVNLLDRRDPDDAPTIMPLGTGGRNFTGFEITPLINEVAPYTGGGDGPEEGDDGQFVEIVNAFTRTLSLAGWRLEGGGTTVWLRSSIPEGGVLVVTDDYNDANDPEPEDEPGRGSLYDVYGAVPAGTKAILQVEPMFNLTNDAGEVSLYNPEGVRVDSFAYKNGVVVGASQQSFQRRDPRIRKTAYGPEDAKPATPLSPNPDAPIMNAADRVLMRAVEDLQNHPFRSSLEVLLVPTNYQKPPVEGLEAEDSTLAGSNDAEDAETEERRLRGEPTILRFASLQSGEGDNYDARLIDMFLPGAPRVRPTRLFSSALLNSSAPADPAGRDALLEQWRQRIDAPRAYHGRINLNTAAGVVLATLPGLDPAIVNRIIQLRLHGAETPEGQSVRPKSVRQPKNVQKGEEWFHPLSPQEPPRWRSLSEFIQDDDIWGSADIIKRIEAVYPFASMVSFNSLSYRVLTASIPAVDQENPDRHATVTAAERIIAGDRGRAETVSFRILKPPVFGGRDFDLEYGYEPKQDGDLAAGVFQSSKMGKRLPYYDGPELPDRPERPKAGPATLQTASRRRSSSTSNESAVATPPPAGSSALSSISR